MSLFPTGLENGLENMDGDLEREDLRDDGDDGDVDEHPRVRVRRLPIVYFPSIMVQIKQTQRTRDQIARNQILFEQAL